MSRDLIESYGGFVEVHVGTGIDDPDESAQEVLQTLPKAALG